MLQITQGHRNAQLSVNIEEHAGRNLKNNVAAPQWSSISAIMFIIYLDGAMEGYGALNYKGEIPERQCAQIDPTTGKGELNKK